ncbi:tetratricopeptide repeat protein 12 isoform X1 [Takifugu rubripes]|uniref:Tetratricopeptide repeat domain 12 n=1 Tax=Takifugu rubripes TaxID=31033 RepID=H2UJS2_TAKRU|nr:tetratricopeptide repeat protein 12 isoform X1 [Takifugu rubripes]XP_029699294.1 tetratricopeptide repeat protein 12 isoform X1 [Takifugu rubripes]XP_029699295.1 tetratricopeptide repeat protein 12 isoform X1 [Takifugu rubripes]
MANLEDFDEFLDKVDKISELVKDLNSSDEVTQQNALKAANGYIAVSDEHCGTKVDTTRINTNPPASACQTLQSDNPADFFKVMEKDAEIRRVRRLEQEKKATALKDRGNEAYAKEDYETAVKYYTDGLTELRDMQPLYTNRAQAFIKLGKYQEAIRDCEWALECNEGCIKAYLHMGKAYLALKKYNESRMCFEKILQIKPGKENLIKEHLNQVDLEERQNQELSAVQELSRGAAEAARIPLLLDKLSAPGQEPFYYCGGFTILAEAVTNSTSQTLFRLNNGFGIIISNDVVRRCLLPKTKAPDSQELCLSVLKLWKVACRGNAENLKILMESPVSKRSIVELLTSDNPAVQQGCLALLCLYTQTPYGRRLATDNLNVHILTKNLMWSITMQQQQREEAAVTVLENFAAENKFFIQLRDVLADAVIVPFTSILRTVSKYDQHVLVSLTSAVGCLTRDDVIRCSFAHNADCWMALVDVVSNCRACEYKEVLYALLGFIMNLSAVASPAIQEHAAALCICCVDLLKDNNGDIVTRAAGVLSTVLPQSSEAVHRALQQNVVGIMHRLLKRNEPRITKYAIQTLAVCTAASRQAREELLRSDKKLSDLRHLLGSSCDETVSGNAALCFAHCLELEGIASNLLGTDIVLLLLRHAAADATNTDVQKNAAIALGKLCRSEPRHADKLREMNGLQILHSCMKLISSTEAPEKRGQ